MSKNTIIERQEGESVTAETRAESHQKVDKQVRYRQILSVLKGKQLTAKEIAVEMNLKGDIPTSERNFTAPRLTELEHSGVVEVIGKKRCQYTEKTVAVYAVREIPDGEIKIVKPIPKSSKKKVNENDSGKSQISFSDII